MANIITKDEEQLLLEAIRKAEARTSGEIKVHLEPSCAKDVLDRAVEVFAQLEMHKTRQRNGVLFYVTFEAHKFAVLGDEGINSKVPENFWDHVKEVVLQHFKEKKYAEGLSLGILMAGDQLKALFPYDQATDINELPDDISFGRREE